MSDFPDAAQAARSEVENTETVEAIIALQGREMAYQEALAVSAEVTQPTLLAFLR